MEFNIRELNSQLDVIKRRRVYGFLAALVFVVVLLVPIWMLYTRSVAIGDESKVELNLVVLLGWIAFIAIMGATAASGVRSHRHGARKVRCEEIGVELGYLDGTVECLLWSDPTLQFELHDLGNVSPSLLTVSSPYFVRTRRTFSALTTDAFNAIFEQAKSRGLIATSRAGPWWLLSSPKQLRIWVIRRSPFKH